MMEPGTKVRMTATYKNLMKRSVNSPHIKEFGNCIGIVQGPVNYNNKGEVEDVGKIGPEVDVRWQPSNLRYAYRPEYLERVE